MCQVWVLWYRADNSLLRRQNEELRSKVDRTSRQCRELSNRVTQQTHLQEKMIQRLCEMDNQAQRSSQQVFHVLLMSCTYKGVVWPKYWAEHSPSAEVARFVKAEVPWEMRCEICSMSSPQKFLTVVLFILMHYSYGSTVNLWIGESYLTSSPNPLEQEAQLSLTNRAMLVCKVVEVWQDFLSEYVDKKFTYICYRLLIRHEWIYYGIKNCVIYNSYKIV